MVLGAAGGTGIAAVQIGKAMGARVIAACSTREKLELAKASGADELINYNKQDLKAAIKDLTNGNGADVVFDPVGGEAFSACSRAMARKGRAADHRFCLRQYSKTFRQPAAWLRNFEVVGVFWGSFVKHETEVFASNVSELFDWYADKKVQLVIDRELPLSETVGRLENIDEPSG